MKDMRKVLLGFMTLLMLTPVLACGMAFCPTMANAAEQQPCHETDGNDGPMLVVDCMGVDLFQQDVSNDIQPDLSVDNVDYAWADLVADYNFQPDNINGIRGPPDQALRPQPQPSIILTTQRFRI
ncbi:MAG: hypothetical protein DHS20C02_11950 [Micavibrio sp.]|nr:MAG: hypothetical protein DHS20C02_11950 [Micavibrio sp.]